MVTAESLCCGTPVVGFKAGAPEQIAIKEFSEFVEYGDLNSLYNKMLVILDTKKRHQGFTNILQIYMIRT